MLYSGQRFAKDEQPVEHSAKYVNFVLIRTKVDIFFKAPFGNGFVLSVKYITPVKIQKVKNTDLRHCDNHLFNC